jgi:hypothetical protein
LFRAWLFCFNFREIRGSHKLEVFGPSHVFQLKNLAQSCYYGDQEQEKIYIFDLIIWIKFSYILDWKLINFFKKKIDLCNDYSHDHWSLLPIFIGEGG